MLPKVATHILHHTSRAVAAVQSPFRNVLQLQSTGSSNSGGLSAWNGVGSSSWGSYGAGPGGAKYNAGSRFYNGYTGAGRAITQANSAPHDNTANQTDENEETTRTPSRTRQSRARSQSLSIGGRNERGEKLGVLKTVQIHVRSTHAFAEQRRDDSSSDPHDSGKPSPRPVLVRRNSTAAHSTSRPTNDLPPPPAHTSSNVSPPTDPAAPQTVSEPFPPSDESPTSSGTPLFRELLAAKNSGKSVNVFQAVQSLQTCERTPSAAEYNMAIEALHETRRPGDPLNPILEIYNNMVKRSVLPNQRTYSLLILALTDRDFEVHKVVVSLESRISRRVTIGRTDSPRHSSDEQRIVQLRSENNFGSAMSLFEALTALVTMRKIPPPIYISLLRSASIHANVDAAIHIFAHMERRKDILPNPVVFSHLITTYMNVGDLAGAKEVFNEFQEACATGRVSWPNAENNAVARASLLITWNKMIETYFRCGNSPGALGLLEQMMDSKVGEEFDPAAVPLPASSTFTTIIAGFCRSGEVGTALQWFKRLLSQDRMARDPYEASPNPPRPDQVAWIVMMDALAVEGMVDELNEVFKILVETASRDGLEIRAVDRIVLFYANTNRLSQDSDKIPSSQALETLDFLVEHVLKQEHAVSPVPLYDAGLKNLTEDLVEQYLRFGAPGQAIDLVERHVETELRQAYQRETIGNMSPQTVHDKMTQLRKLAKSLTPHILTLESKSLPFKDLLRTMRLCDRIGMLPTKTIAPYYLQGYALAKKQNELPDLTMRDWELLAYGAAKTELPAEDGDEGAVPAFEFPKIASLLRDFVHHGVMLDKMHLSIVQLIIKALYTRYNAAQLRNIVTELGPSYESILNNSERDVKTLRASFKQTETSGTSSPVHVDIYHSRFIDEFYPNHPTVTPLIAYERFDAGVKDGVYPIPATIGRLINVLGRVGELEKVRTLYSTAQMVLASLENEKEWQSRAWFQIEDQMIIAYAHAGDMDSAMVHRTRILEQDGAPTPDAYGALIQNVKDTTDDTSNAMALFQEAQAYGVVPNIYLYNTIISKLSKARKADFALELFQQMKASGVQPSSITYGAVIAACARVGDAHSAELLFMEMASQRNFKPRIPPYNTMMQMYTHTKPDREKVLHYFDALVKAGITPSAHSYKILMDAYGTIEPVDIDAMTGIFQRVADSRDVHLQGSHWASMINAWGCVRKNLDKAIEIFESIPSHPSSRRQSLPDAITYEALFNVIVNHRQTNLLSKYMERLQASNVHMTAYIANQIIKGFAICGDLPRARDLFESLADPPEGVAAPNNHAPHDSNNSSATSLSSPSPVYREPSTWEAMIRGELANGQRDRAIALLERLQARKFPPAVYNRISGIMLDDSVSPWPATDSPITSDF